MSCRVGDLRVKKINRVLIRPLNKIQYDPILTEKIVKFLGSEIVVGGARWYIPNKKFFDYYDALKAEKREKLFIGEGAKYGELEMGLMTDSMNVRII